MRYRILVILAFLPFLLRAQQLNLPLNHEYLNDMEHELNAKSSQFHTAVKPYLQSEVEAWENLDSIIEEPEQEGFKVHISKGDIFEFKKKKVYIGINPLIDISTGYDISEKKFLYSAGYGAEFKANLGNKLSLGFNVQGIQDKPAMYIENFIRQTHVEPGYRKAKETANGFSSIMYSGYISYTPAKYFNIQVGNDKNFWGDGYRSLFLSDNATNYPYLKLTANFWRIKYVYLLNFMKYQPVDSTFAFDFNKEPELKYAAFHYLSIDIAKWMQWGFFEGVIWQHADTNGVRGLEFNYLNPLVFIRPIEFALGSPDNITLGMNFKFRPHDDHTLYMQFLLDDLDIAKTRNGKGYYRTKIAIQGGYKAFDLFNVKGLNFQTEFNLVRPYVYAHKIAEQNYAHMNQSLAHPLNANFYEYLAFFNYTKNRWKCGLKFQYAKQGADIYGQHSGSNIFVSDYVINFGDLDNAYDNKFLQGEETNYLHTELRGGYLINPKINLRAEAFLDMRRKKSASVNEISTMIGVSFKTGLFNRYTDF